MKKIFNKLGVIGVIITLMVSATIISVSSKENVCNKDLIKIVVLDSMENKISERYISYDIYNKIFEENNFPNDLSIFEYIDNKLNTLVEYNIISLEKSNELQNDLKLSFNDDGIHHSILPFNYDALNIFNGIFFKLEGEKLSSFFDLNVFNFPILNTNITALFSGYSTFQGTGFMFSIGFLGFQNVFKFSLTQPHFPEISGGILGFVGILIISKGIQTESSNSKILGIGMDVLTFWNEVE